MSKKVKITDFKTRKIEKLTGGFIKSYQIADYPKSSFSDGLLTNSFVSKDGVYMGDYAQGWWYVRRGLKVCEDYPHGVAELHEEGVHVGYYGFTHRGGQIFKLGDRLFDESYKPVEKDFTEKDWEGFKLKRQEAIDKNIKDGYVKDQENGLRETSLCDVIPFKMRGTILISSFDEMKEAAINMSKYLS